MFLGRGLSPDFSVVYDPKKIQNCLANIPQSLVFSCKTREILFLFLRKSHSITSKKKVQAITQEKISNSNLK